MNMIEKVARAINEIRENGSAVDLAKAAIIAMREPSEEMLKAGYTLCINSDNMDEVYIKMIDAALKE